MAFDMDVYDRSDIFPTIKMLRPLEGKIDIKLKEDSTFVFLKVKIPEDKAELFADFCRRRRVNRLGSGKFSVDAIKANNLYIFVGSIRVTSLTSLGAVVNPFTKKFLKVYNIIMGKEDGNLDTL